MEADVKGKILQLETNSDIFSPSGADRGTLAMLEDVCFEDNDKVLDLGCGCGIVGIYAAKCIGGQRVWLCDVSENAVAISKRNAKLNDVCDVKVIQSDGFENIDEYDYTVVLSNPPYHTDFSVAKGFIENGFKHLAVGGRLYMVTKRLDWYKNKITAVFGGVKVQERDGYYVFCAQKRSEKTARVNLKKTKQNKNKLSKKLAKKYSR